MLRLSVEITPHILINGDGQRAYAKPVMNSSKQIVRVDLVDGGEDYSVARAEVVGKKNTDTVHPTLTPVLSPKGGHGSNILNELNVKDVLLVVRLTPEDSEKILPYSSYRQFGIIKNPVLNDGTNSIAGRDNLYHRDITLIAENGAVTLSDFGTGSGISNTVIGTNASVVIGSESFSSAKIVQVKSSTNDRVTLKTLNSSGKFVSKLYEPGYKSN